MTSAQTSLTAGHIFALTTRADLLAEEAALVCERSINWRGRLHELGDYGTRGGSAMDRRLIVEAMARLEARGGGIFPALSDERGTRHIVTGEPPWTLCGATVASRSIDVWHVVPESWRCAECERRLA